MTKAMREAIEALIEALNNDDVQNVRTWMAKVNRLADQGEDASLVAKGRLVYALGRAELRRRSKLSS